MMNRKQAIEWIKLLAAGHTAPEAKEAAILAIEALDKSDPKAPTKDDVDLLARFCPSCGIELDWFEGGSPQGNNYCDYCGQRISWKEEEREK